MGLDNSGMRDHGAGGAAGLGNLGAGKGKVTVVICNQAVAICSGPVYWSLAFL